MNTPAMHTTRMPVWIYLVATLGVAWNLFGLVQLMDFVSQTRQSLMMRGMSAATAELYYNLPAWMKFSFAIGSLGGLTGSIALALRHRATVVILATSLAGYVAIWLSDYAHGVFDVIPGQMAILTMVVVIAIALFCIAITVRGRGLLRVDNR